MADIVQDNRQDTDGEGSYRDAFLDTINQRIGEYSSCTFNRKDGPGFVFLRMLGDHVSMQMGAKDNKWITGYVVDIAGAQLYKNLRRVLPGLLDPAIRG